MSDELSFHMSPDDFRAHGHEIVDWIADYMERVEKLPVLSRAQPGEIRAQLPAHAPEQGEPFGAVLRDIETIIFPGVTHWQSPNFFAYFPANVSAPSILGELLSAGLGVQGMLWATSPACTELETHVLDWLVEMLGLPSKFQSNTAGGGVIQDTASSAVLCALLAARDQRLAAESDPSQRDQIRRGLMVYASREAHSSIQKATKIAGFEADQLRLVDVDERQAMRVDALSERIAHDREQGRHPLFVCGTMGTTSSNAMDPLAEIGTLCRSHELWFHVDGAMSGTATLCPEFRHLLTGLEHADSYAFNPHKWMFTNFDCCCMYVADRGALLRSLSILPEYLKNAATDAGRVIDYRDWHIPLGRRFRALKLWFVIRHYGVQGLQHHVREHVRLAQQFADWVRSDPDYELVGEPPLNLVCFRHVGGDDVTRQILDHINASGRAYLSHTVLRGQYTIRVAIGQTHTQRSHVQGLWDLIRASAAEITRPPNG